MGGIAAAGAHLIDNTVQTMLVKYDGMGNLQWHRVYPGYHVYEMIDLIESRNGGFLIAGEVINPDAFTQRPFLIKTKPEGPCFAKETFRKSVHASVKNLSGIQ